MGTVFARKVVVMLVVFAFVVVRKKGTHAKGVVKSKSNYEPTTP